MNCVPCRRDLPDKIRLSLSGIGSLDETSAGLSCPRCGGRGFNLHQRTTKKVKDPFISRISVARYLCKSCGAVKRRYPAGAGPDRQTDALRQLTAFLACLGLTYRDIRAALADLGCPLSITSIRQSVTAVRASGGLPSGAGLVRLKWAGMGRLESPDGPVRVSLGSTSAHDRWVDLNLPAGPIAEEIRWRLSNWTGLRVPEK